MNCFIDKSVLRWTLVVSLIVGLLVQASGCQRAPVAPTTKKVTSTPVNKLPASIVELNELANELLRNQPAPLDLKKFTTWPDFEKEVTARTGESTWDDFTAKVRRLPQSIQTLKSSRLPSTGGLDKRLKEIESKLPTLQPDVQAKIKAARQAMNAYEAASQKFSQEIAGLASDSEPLVKAIDVAIADVAALRDAKQEEFGGKMAAVLADNGSVGKLLAADYTSLGNRYESLKPATEEFQKTYSAMTRAIDELAESLDDKGLKDESKKFKEEGTSFGEKVVTALEAAGTAFLITSKLFGVKVGAIVAAVVFVVVLLALLFSSRNGGGGSGEGDGKGDSKGNSAGQSDSNTAGTSGGGADKESNSDGGGSPSNGIQLPRGTVRTPVEGTGPHGVELLPQPDGSVQLVLAPNKVADPGQHFKLLIPGKDMPPAVADLTSAICAQQATRLTVSIEEKTIGVVFAVGMVELKLVWQRPAPGADANAPLLNAG